MTNTPKPGTAPSMTLSINNNQAMSIGQASLQRRQEQLRKQKEGGK